MAINAVMPVFQEIPAVTAVPQLSLTRRDRELQMEEGRPPMEVASAEQEALHWRKNEDLQGKWKRRHQRSRRNPSQDKSWGNNPEDKLDTDVEGCAAQTKPILESAELPEEEKTGTLFDDRS